MCHQYHVGHFQCGSRNFSECFETGKLTDNYNRIGSNFNLQLNKDRNVLKSYKFDDISLIILGALT